VVFYALLLQRVPSSGVRFSILGQIAWKLLLTAGKILIRSRIYGLYAMDVFIALSLDITQTCAVASAII